MKTTLLFNEKSQITGIREHWLFDKMYTAFALHDFDPNHNGKLDKDELMQLATENMNGLKEFNYFTVMEMMDGKAITLGAATNIESFLENEQIVIAFTLPLNEPLDMTARQMTLRIYDPTYYIDMGYYEKDPVSFDKNAPKSCTFKVTRPAVDINMISAAAALDKKAVAPKDFGYSFAEVVTVSCK